MESAEEKNAGIRATRRGLQELEDSEPSLVALDQPIRVSFVASTSASTQVQGEVVEKDEIEAIQLTGDHLIEDIEWPVEEAIEKPLEVQLCPSTQGDVSDLPERVNPTSSTSVEAIEKAVKVDFPPTQVTSAPQEPGALSDPPECANPTSSTPGVASPGAVAVGGRNSSIGDYTITALVTRASATENQSTSGSTRPVSARLVPDTQEDYELLEEQLRQKEQQLRHQEQQFQRVLEREHVPIAEVIANDEEAQREITATRADERNPSTNKVISLFCGSSWKRISTAIAILVVIGLVVGVVIGLKSPSSNDEACIRDLSKADQDGNGMLNQKEYYYFVNLFTEDAYINLPGFPDLPQPLRRNFFRLRNEETKQLHIGDSKEEVDAEIKDKICKATELTISTLPPPTDSPTQITSETAPPPPPPNNDCENANAVAVDIPSSGSTVHATKSGSDCGTSVEAPGLWYTLGGTGDRLGATTSSSSTNFDTKLSVYSGTCGSLTCVGGNDDSGVNSQSLVTWNSVRGVQYFVLVHGFGGETGNFELMVTQLFPPPNDSCENAETVTSGLPISGSTVAATKSGLSCNGTSVSAPGVWYTLNGTGDRIGATTSSSNTNFDTKINVYSGICDELTCVDGNDDDATSLHSLVKWNSIRGAQYFILVHGYGTGNFELTVTQLFPPPNDDCKNAETVTFGLPVSGSTVAATKSGFDCNGISVSAPGVWYTVVGTGDRLRATTRSSNTNYDTKLNVYSGSCGNLTCVGGNDDISNGVNLQSLVDWNSINSVQYYVLVHGYEGATGNFEVAFRTL
jgi:hypothetical protein